MNTSRKLANDSIKVIALIRPVRANLQFLRSNFRTILFWPVFAIVIIAAGWYLLLRQLDEDRRHIETFALTQTATLSRSYAAHLKRETDEIDRTMLLLREHWTKSDGRLRLEEFQIEGLFPQTSPFIVSIVDANGMLQTSTGQQRMNRSSFDVTDRPYFQVQQQATEDFLYIGLPTFGRTTGLPVVQFSRRLLDANGRFAGVLLLSVKTSYFTDNYDEVVLHSHGLLAIVGDDGQQRVVLAIVGDDGQQRVARIGQKIFPPLTNVFSATPSFNGAGGSMHLDGERWFTDRRSRFVGWQRVNDYPAIAIIGLDEAEVLSSYSVSREYSIRNGMWASLAMLAFTSVAFTLSWRLAKRKHQMELGQATYRMATEGGNEGFFIARPKRDEEGRIVDFQAIDCNQRGADLFRMRREQFIGRTTANLQDAQVSTRLTQTLERAMDYGQAEGEFEISSGGWGRKRFLHLRAVRSDNNLAITLRDMTHEKAYVRELERRSNEDALTRLPNRPWAQSYIPKALETAAKEETMLALLFIDLDGFKAVNDSFGHAAGDEVLCAAAQRLKDAIRPHDNVVRWGGDEFVVILEQVMQKSDAVHVAKRILRAFEENFSLVQGAVSVGTSIGISVYPQDATHAETLIRHADAAMYSVKSHGKRHYQFFDPSAYEAMLSKERREADLRRAIERDQFVMYYQPRIDLISGNMTGMEALVRWNHPSEGLIESAEFVPLAEQTGLILRLGKLIFNKVCAQMATWIEQGEPVLPVSVNLSLRQLNDADFGNMVVQALEKYAINPALIAIEVTEATMMDRSPKVNTSLNTMHARRVKLIVDDFGIGYSSMPQLQQRDVDLIKVDPTLTASLGKTRQGEQCFMAIVTMAHTLGIHVVAEGVETREQLAMLCSLACDEVQGFYVAAPLPPMPSQRDMAKRVSRPANGDIVHFNAFRKKEAAKK